MVVLHGSARSPFCNSVDADGEAAYFRVRDIALLEVAKDVTDPEAFDEENSDLASLI
jgi:hypothetical protein